MIPGYHTLPCYKVSIDDEYPHNHLDRNQLVAAAKSKRFANSLGASAGFMAGDGTPKTRERISSQNFLFSALRMKSKKNSASLIAAVTPVEPFLPFLTLIVSQ